jgi:ferredoxin/flavodoxin---NADP+ reductase
MALELPPLPAPSPRLGGIALPPLPGAAPGVARPARDLAPNASLADRIDLTPELARFRIRPDAGVPPFKPGQYLSIGIPSPDGPLLRPYSIASAPGDRDELELLIRRLDDGALTRRLWALRPGDRVWTGPAKGLFHLDAVPDPAAPHLFLGAGSGLAPVMAMLGALAALPAGARPHATLVQGATRTAELAYADRLAGWARDGWLDHVPTISRPADADNAGWTGAAGRVEAHIVRVLAERGLDPGTVRAYACGNDGMVAACRAALAVAGVPETRIRFESFTPTRPVAPAALGARPV